MQVVENIEMPEDSLKYKRVLLKLSGEALMGQYDYGIDPEVISRIGAEIAHVESTWGTSRDRNWWW